MATFKPIYFEQGYEVDEFGNVKNTKTGKILKPWITKNGYKQIQIRKNVYSIHRLVAKVFYPLSEFLGGQVLHLDDNKLNNHYLNLRWGTQSQNMKMAYKNNKISKKGSKHHLAKLDESKVLEIRKRLSLGQGVIFLSKQYGVCHQTISNIKLKKSWV